MPRSTRLVVLFCLAALPLIASSPLPVGGSGTIDSYGPQIAAGGSGFFLTWLEYDGTPQHRLYGSRVSDEGQLLDGGGVLLTAEDPIASRVQFDGTHYVVAFTTDRPSPSGTHVRVLYISPETGAVVQDVTVPDARGYDLALAVSAEAAFLAWLDDDASLELARIPRTAGTVERASLPVGAAAYPTLSWNGSSLLVAWNTMHLIIGSPTFTVPDAVYAARVSDTLAMLDPAPLLLDTVEGTPAMDASAPSAASDGHEWLVAWGSGSSVRATRVSAEGVRGAVTDMAPGEAPLVFRKGDRYALAWKESVSPSSDVRRLFLADVTIADDQLGVASPRTAALIPFFGDVSSAAGGADRDVAVAWAGASAPEFDWQASFRILDPGMARRRSVGHR